MTALVEEGRRGVALWVDLRMYEKEKSNCLCSLYKTKTYCNRKINMMLISDVTSEHIFTVPDSVVGASPVDAEEQSPSGFR